MTHRVPRAEKMKLLAVQMRQVHQKMEELNYDSHILSLQGKQEVSFKKAKAAKFAKEHWLKLDNEYRTLWKKERRKRAS